MHRIKVVGIAVFLLLILLPLALAETGCFTYKGSPFFCSDIPREQALNECELYGCNVDQAFYSERSCSEKEILKHCELSTLVDVPEDLPTVPEIISELTSGLDENIDGEEGTNYVLVFGFVILIIAALAIYFTYKNNPQYFQKLFFPKQQQKQQPLNVILKVPSWLGSSDDSKLKKQKLRWEKKHHKKVHEFQRDQLLQEFGPRYEQSVTKEFRKLKGLVRTYKHRKKQNHKSNSKEQFAKLEELGKKIKKKEQFVIQAHSQVDPKIIKRYELDNLMKDLKEIYKGKY